MNVTDVLDSQKWAAIDSGYRGGYFVSYEQEEIAQAAVLLNLSKTKKRLAALREQARSLGQELSKLASVLEQSPELLSFDGQDMGMNYGMRRIDMRAAILDSKRIAALAEDIRKTQDEKNHLERTVKELGLEV